jgi:hypothetical protein
MTRKKEKTGAPISMDSKLNIQNWKKVEKKQNSFRISSHFSMDVENQNPDSEFPFWKPIPRRFKPDSPFFAIGNLERELLVKQVLIFYLLFLFNQFEMWIVTYYLCFIRLLWNLQKKMKHLRIWYKRMEGINLP